ncbi:MAG: hypothetical protein GXN93_02340 [Candidatus Diapherotrites archaeon]|nr:hypothetical protein [Candidatus Diapherotrites archaeon]
MKHRLKGTMHDFIDHLALLSWDQRSDPFHVLAEHDRTDLKDTPYWTDLERIAGVHGLKWIDGVAVYTSEEKRKRIAVLLTDGSISVEGAIVLTESGVTTFHGSERTAPHPDCGPPGWIKGSSDVKNDVALITKLSFYPRITELLEDLPVDVYGVGMPGRTSLALLTKYKSVLYLDDLDPCGIRRYLEWKKLICPEYVGIKVEWLQSANYENFRIEDYDQWFLTENELTPPELEEEARFLAAEMIVELEEVVSATPERIMSDVKEAIAGSFK